MTQRHPFTLPVLLALFAVYIIWGSTYLGIALAIDGIPPLLMAGTRFWSAGLLMLLWLKHRGHPLPTLRQWGNALLIGSLMLGVGNGAVTIAEQWVATGLAAVMIATVPLFSILCAHWLLGQRAHGIEWLGLAVGFAGILLLNSDQRLSGQPLGAFLLLAAAFCWALGSALSRRINMPTGPMSSAAQMLCAGVCMSLAGLLHGERIHHIPPAKAMLATAYLAVFGSLIAYSAYQYLLKTVRPALATSYAYVNPLVAVGLGTLFLSEPVTPRMVLAMTIILSAVLLVMLAQWQRSRQQR
ncbi:drug/metabolite exporter YedA [Leeia sp.]|uniref:drug/metabolite exporter YedA n=1 Tax=Leeia sp. TaxID=2884678 RepID=UPI0035B4CC7A